MSLSTILAGDAGVVAAEPNPVSPTIKYANIIIAGHFLVDCRGALGVGWRGRLNGMSAVVASLSRGDLEAMGGVRLLEMVAEILHRLVGGRTVAPGAAVLGEQLVRHEHVVCHANGELVIDGLAGLMLGETLDFDDTFPKSGERRVGGPGGGESVAVLVDVSVGDLSVGVAKMVKEVERLDGMVASEMVGKVNVVGLLDSLKNLLLEGALDVGAFVELGERFVVGLPGIGDLGAGGARRNDGSRSGMHWIGPGLGGWRRESHVLGGRGDEAEVAMSASSTGGGDCPRVGVDLPHQEGDAGCIGLPNDGREGGMRESKGG